MNVSPTVILAAGGTGGHIFPADALAEELQARGANTIFITDKRFNLYKGALAETPRYTVRCGTLGKSFLRKIVAIGDVLVGQIQARMLLKHLRPQAVVGFGGYPSFPTMYAATTLGIPSIIHEQNSVLGRANRMLANRVDAIATTFPTTRLLPEQYNHKIMLTGNPVCASVRALHEIPYPELAEEGHIRILVTGGSQGASIFSQVVPAAIFALPASLRMRIRIDQQCREADIDTTRAAYTQMNVSADVSPFFTDIPARLASAHLVIARAGASTIAELTSAGRPSILVPLPTSRDNHQLHNASSIEEAGAGWMIPQEEFTASILSKRLESFFSMPQSLARAAACARRAGRIFAARDLANLALRLANGSVGVKENDTHRPVMEEAA